jgi:hypothetical protein
MKNEPLLVFSPAGANAFLYWLFAKTLFASQAEQALTLFILSLFFFEEAILIFRIRVWVVIKYIR